MPVLADQLLDVRPHAFGLTLQHDDDGRMLAQLQQAQEALSESSLNTNTDMRWWKESQSQPDLKLAVHQSCSK